MLFFLMTSLGQCCLHLLISVFRLERLSSSEVFYTELSLTYANKTKLHLVSLDHRARL